MKNKDLMRYIPKDYKKEVVDIYKDKKVWNEDTKRWNTMITVEWIDGEVNTYQNAEYMKGLLKYFGR